MTSSINQPTDPPLKIRLMGLRGKMLILIAMLTVLALLVLLLGSLVNARARVIQRQIDTAYSVLQVVKTIASFHHTHADEDRVEGGFGVRLSEAVNRELLHHVGMLAIGSTRDGESLQITSIPPVIDDTVFVYNEGFFDQLWQALFSIVRERRWLVRLVGRPSMELLPEGTLLTEIDLIELVFEEERLREQLHITMNLMARQSILVILLMMLGVLFVIEFSWIRRLTQVVQTLNHFRKNPRIAPLKWHRRSKSLGIDEIDVVDQEVYRMSVDVSRRFADQSRLVSIGGAVARINHDLRASLAPALILSDQILSSSTEEKARKAARDIIQTLERAEHISDGVLSFVRSDEPIYEIQKTSLFSIIKNAIDDVMHRFPEMKIALSGDEALIRADAVHFSRVFANLLTNSAQSGAKDVSIRVLLQKQTERARALMSGVFPTLLDVPFVLIQIQDDGPGLPLRVQKHLFQPFVQSQKSQGTGLGLTIVKELVEAHGGTIALQQTSPYGTTWALQIPQIKTLR